MTEAEMERPEVPLGDLRMVHAVFQPRSRDEEPWTKERHVDTLAKAVKQGADLEPLTVFAIAGEPVVVDGHCRAAAYRKAGKPDAFRVPVRFLRGAFEDALAYSLEANSRDKLPLTATEKTEQAWKLVVFNERRRCYSGRQIARISGVAAGTVTNMRRALEGLSDDEDAALLTWKEVKRKGRAEQTYDEDWEEKLAKEWAKRLRETFGPKPESQVEAFIDALEQAYPQVWRAIEGRTLDGFALEALEGEANADF